MKSFSEINKLIVGTTCAANIINGYENKVNAVINRIASFIVIAHQQALVAAGEVANEFVSGNLDEKYDVSVHGQASTPEHRIVVNMPKSTLTTSDGIEVEVKNSLRVGDEKSSLLITVIDKEQFEKLTADICTCVRDHDEMINDIMASTGLDFTRGDGNTNFNVIIDTPWYDFKLQS